MWSRKLAVLLLSGTFLMPMIAHATLYMVRIVDYTVTQVVVFESMLDVSNQFDPSQYINLTGVTITEELVESLSPSTPILLTETGMLELQKVFKNINNINPTADAGGPYGGYENMVISLTAAASTDPDNDITTYEWDLDDDGYYDDATGVTTDFSSATNGTYTISVRITDEHDDSDTDTASVAVSSFTIESSALLDGKLLLSWQSLSGTVYSVLYTLSLTNEWQPVAGGGYIQSTGGLMSFTNLPTAGGTVFYRLSVTSE